MRPDPNPTLSDDNIEMHLSNALGVQDQGPNIALAEKIVLTNNENAVAALIDILGNGKTPARTDAIKVLYEIGARDPSLIASFTNKFLVPLTGNNNRLVWGCLTALHEICKLRPDAIYPHLNAIILAADAGSVIAKDQAINILVILASHVSYAKDAMPMLFERLSSSANNQFPMYAKRCFPIMQTKEQKNTFLRILNLRLQSPLTPAKKKRIQALLKKLT